MKKGFWSGVKKMGTLRLAGLKRLSVSRKPGQEEMKDEPKQVSNDEKCKQLEEQMENSEFYKEYESVPMCRPGRQCTIASYPENVDKNRYQDVVPYEDTRVKLVPTKENSTGYINASHIRVKVGEQEWHYIATQGPLSHTCQDFWQMVWEQGVSIIAMVTAEEENGREKSFRYWPRLGSQKNSVTFGEFKITTQSHTECGCYATTMLKIQHLPTGQERTACHLQYTDWPTYSCPEDFKGFLAYLGEIQSTRKNTNSIDDSMNINPPMVVHCSAGAGRSGVVILSEIMIACLENNELLDIPKFLWMLRDQRMMMVQTLPQYTFVYKVLIEHHRNSRLI